MKKNVVYFLGAGFSKAYGYPLTVEIMPEILSVLRGRPLDYLNKFIRETVSEKEKRNARNSKLLEYLYLLYPGLKELKQDVINQINKIPNITEVLSFVDHCCLYNIPPHPKLGEENLRSFQGLLKRATEELLLNYELMPYTDSEKKLLSLFFDPIDKKGRQSEVSIITTNYDLIVDYQFKADALQHKIDYGINYRNTETQQSEIVYQTDTPLLKYFKLHGSLNWVKCDYCGQYYINPHGSILHQTYINKEHADNTCICNDLLILKSVMVTPSFVRDIRDSNLLQVWKGAMEAIRNADKLIFIGYSLPAEDLAIKSIIIRGINGREGRKKLEVDVVQKSEGPKSNYEILFGKNINYYSTGLEDYLSNKANKLS